MRVYDIPLLPQRLLCLTCDFQRLTTTNPYTKLALTSSECTPEKKKFILVQILVSLILDQISRVRVTIAVFRCVFNKGQSHGGLFWVELKLLVSALVTCTMKFYPILWMSSKCRQTWFVCSLGRKTATDNATQWTAVREVRRPGVIKVMSSDPESWSIFSSNWYQVSSEFFG